MRLFRKRYIFLLLLVVLLSVLGYYIIYFWTLPTDHIQPLSFVPPDATYMIETDRPLEHWHNLTSNPAWQHLMGNESFAELTEAINSLDSIIREESWLLQYIGQRNLILSGHVVAPNTIDFLYVIDLKQIANFSLLKKLIFAVQGDGINVTTRQYKGHEIIEITDKVDLSTFYLAYVKNVVIASMVPTLVEASLDHYQQPQMVRDPGFLEVRQEAAGDLPRIFLNHEWVPKYLRLYMDDDDGSLLGWNQSLRFTGLSLDLMKTGELRLSGATNINESSHHLLKALAHSGSSRHRIPKVASNRTAMYLSIGFDDFEEFNDNFLKELQYQTDDFLTYQVRTEQVEKFLNISLKEQFASWMGDEIGLLQLSPKQEGAAPEFVAILEANNVQKARAELGTIEKQVLKKTPSKFKVIYYKGYEIHFLSLKDFFKLFFGKLFAQFDRPYYTIIGDHVIFSNHPQTLKNMIDDYESGYTLDKVETFQDMMDKLENTSSMLVYLRTPELFPNLQSLMSRSSWKTMQKNSPYILCFSQIAFQWTSEGGLMHTRLISDFSTAPEVVNRTTNQPSALGPPPPPLLEDTLEEQLLAIEEITPEDINAKRLQEYFDNGELKFDVPLTDGLKDGTYREYFETGQLKVKGKYKDDQKDGVWKYYDTNGDLVKKERYKYDKLQ